MGLLDDLSMGLGLKDRDQNYYDRTAETLGGARGEQYRQSSGFGRLGRQGLLSGSSMGKYRDMNDMFDRGGPDASGGKFEGGGLLSEIANLLTKRTPITQTEGYGNSAKILGERTNSSGLSRPFNLEFHNTYRAALDNNLIPGMTTYDDYYDMMFP